MRLVRLVRLVRELLRELLLKLLAWRGRGRGRGGAGRGGAGRRGGVAAWRRRGGVAGKRNPVRHETQLRRGQPRGFGQPKQCRNRENTRGWNGGACARQRAVLYIYL